MVCLHETLPFGAQGRGGRKTATARWDGWHQGNFLTQQDSKRLQQHVYGTRVQAIWGPNTEQGKKTWASIHKLEAISNWCLFAKQKQFSPKESHFSYKPPLRVLWPAVHGQHKKNSMVFIFQDSFLSHTAWYGLIFFLFFHFFLNLN